MAAPKKRVVKKTTKSKKERVEKPERVIRVSGNVAVAATFVVLGVTFLAGRGSVRSCK